MNKIRLSGVLETERSTWELPSSKYSAQAAERSTWQKAFLKYSAPPCHCICDQRAIIFLCPQHLFQTEASLSRMSHGRLVAGACCLAALLSGKEGSKEGSWTNCETPEREEQAIKLDGLSVAEIKEMQDSAEKHVFLFQVRFLPHRSGHVTINSRLTLLLPGRGEPDDETDHQLTSGKRRPTLGSSSQTPRTIWRKCDCLV